MCSQHSRQKKEEKKIFCLYPHPSTQHIGSPLSRREFQNQRYSSARDRRSGWNYIEGRGQKVPYWPPNYDVFRLLYSYFIILSSNNDILDNFGMFFKFVGFKFEGFILLFLHFKVSSTFNENKKYLPQWLPVWK